MKTAPAFQFYASDAIADKRYRLMSLAERGLYLSMLAECWVNGAVPSSVDSLAQWLGYRPEDVRAALTQRVLSFFEEKDGELTNADLERYRRELEERREKMSAGGKKGGRRSAEARQHHTGDDVSHPSSHPSSFAQAPRVEKRGVEERTEERSTGGADNSEWLEAYDSNECIAEQHNRR